MRRVAKDAPVAQLDRASAFYVDADQVQVVASVALTSCERSLCCSKVAPRKSVNSGRSELIMKGPSGGSMLGKGLARCAG